MNDLNNRLQEFKLWMEKNNDYLAFRLLDFATLEKYNTKDITLETLKVNYDRTKINFTFNINTRSIVKYKKYGSISINALSRCIDEQRAKELLEFLNN